MSMRKKQDQRNFLRKVHHMSYDLKMISAHALNGLLGWTDFLKKYEEKLLELRDLFRELGL